MRTNLLVEIDGVDEIGKTTFAKMLIDSLKNDGISAHYFHAHKKTEDKKYVGNNIEYTKYLIDRVIEVSETRKEEVLILDRGFISNVGYMLKRTDNGEDFNNVTRFSNFSDLCLYFSPPRFDVMKEFHSCIPYLDKASILLYKNKKENQHIVVFPELPREKHLSYVTGIITKMLDEVRTQKYLGADL